MFNSPLDSSLDIMLETFFKFLIIESQITQDQMVLNTHFDSIVLLC